MKARWKTFIVERDGEPLTVYLHLPGTFRNPNYWAWTCKRVGIFGRSLKVETFADAKDRVVAWFKGEPRRAEREKQAKSVLPWDDWDAIQVAHYGQKRDQRRAARTLEECRKAQRLFVAITGAEAASAVDIDMVGRFQIECPQHASKFGRPYSNNTVIKTLAHLSAAFNRCNRAAGKKCIRGVLPAERLLDSNPFEQIQWVEPGEKPIRQFTTAQLKAFFAWKYLGACPLASLFARVSLWSCGRLEEMTELRWDWVHAEGYIAIPNEAAKWGKGKTVRIPPALLADIAGYRDSSPFVWASYVSQLRDYHQESGHRRSAHKVRDFAPQRLRVTFQRWIGQWAKETKAEGISHHAFRRTGLQWSREGQLRSLETDYARASNVSLSVAERHYMTRPHRLWADLTYRNIAEEIRKDGELADLMGLREQAVDTVVSVDGVHAALERGDVEEAKRLVTLLRG